MVASKSKPSSPDHPPMFSNKTVLLADDSDSLCKVLTPRLESLGLHVVKSHDAAHALFLIHKHMPDFAILDIVMPGGNGIAVLEMLRTDPRFARLPVAILTGMNDDRNRIRTEVLRAHYIIKCPTVWESLRKWFEECAGEMITSA